VENPRAPTSISPARLRLLDRAPGRAPTEGNRDEVHDHDVRVGASMSERSPEWLTGLGELMMALDGELREAGELIASDGLTDPLQATTIRFTDGVPIVTDGPFAEVKESLAGYWVIEATHERAVEITSRAVAYTEYPMEIRQLMDHSAQP
jgi:hypothetical protein